MNEICPFCNSKRKNHSFKEIAFLCGTFKNGDEYETSTFCDKECFRNAFVRCHDLLVRIVDGATLLKGNDPTIPLKVYQDILQELNNKD